MTLDELKQQNREAEAQQEQLQAEPEDDGHVAEPETAGDDHPEEGEQQKQVPDWMLSDDQASHTEAEKSDQSVPVQTLISVRRKLKGRVSERDGEIERLRSEIETLKAGTPRQAPVTDTPAPAAPPRPRRDDFYSAADPDAAYEAALEQWHDKRLDQRLNHIQQSHQQQQQQSQQQQSMQRALDQHVDRAAAIIAEGHLSAEEWTDADDYVRRSVDSVRPGEGDIVVDNFISRLGKGSEKVMIALSRNQTFMEEFRQNLRDDPTGLSAMSYLGSLKARFEVAAKSPRSSRAPKPGTQLQGDSKTGGSEQRAYNAAHKAGDRQKAINIKMAAKRRGVDTSTW